MKRFVTILTMILALLMTSLLMAGCGNTATTTEDEQGPLRVIATVFPQYDFIRQIAGDRVELSMLLSPGAEPHGFEPTPRDIIAIDRADLLVYVGGHGDFWVQPILESLERLDMRTVALMDFVDAVHKEIVEGMEHVHDHGHSHGHDHGHGHGHSHGHHHHDHDDEDCDDHDHHHGHGHHHHHDHDEDCDDDDHHHGHHHHDHHHGHDDEDCDDHGHGHHHHDHDHEDCDDHDHEDCDDHGHHHHHHDHHHHHHHEEYDEHVWTCPRNAILIVQGLTEVLAEMDPDNAYFFRDNAAAFIVQLQELDAAFTQVVAEGVRSTVVFGDRFPFRYLMNTYGLTYFAAFPGCSVETQASPATIAFLIDKVQHENIPVVFHIEFSNRLIANVIAEATGARLVELHSVNNISHADFNAGVTYLDIMWRNVESLREGLN